MPFVAKSAAPSEPYPGAAHRVLDRAATGGITLLTAPPGYLLSEGLFEALQRQDRDVTWVRLDPEDRDPGTLLLSMVAAIRQQQPGFGRSTLELMRHQPGPIAGWPPLFGRLAAELTDQGGRSRALVLQHVHRLGRASPALALLGGEFLPALNGDTACILISHSELPAAALPARTVRRDRLELCLAPAVAHELVERAGPELGREPARRVAALCGGAVAILLGVCGAATLLGAAAAERAIRHASRVQDLLAYLAREWLRGIGVEDRRALGLALRLEYSHPALSSAVLGKAGLLPGPWLQPLAGGWSRVRTVWRDPFRSALTPDRLLGAELLHRAAEYLRDRGATERAIPLYLDLRDPACAAHAVTREVDGLMQFGRWDTLRAWLAGLQQTWDDRWPGCVASRSAAVGAYGGELPTVGLQLATHQPSTYRLPPRAEGQRHGGSGGSLPPPTVPTLVAHLLGRLRVSLNGVVVDDWPSGRGRSLLKYLVTHRDPWPQREVLMEVFWPGSPPAAARNSLNVAVHGLRRALRAAANLPVVVLKDGAYCLAADLQVWVDVDEFERHVERGRRLERAGEQADAITEYELAASLYQGDFLVDDPYEEWPVLYRERVRLAYLDTLDRLSGLYLGQGRHAACAALCQRIIERDACREDAHRRLIRCYSRQGQRHLALRQFQACAEALRTELDVDPAPATVRLHEAIRHHEAV
jgi:DNA-binding SARP family transcriptional activator